MKIRPTSRIPGMNIHFRELAGESPLLVKLIMQSIYKNNDGKCATWVASVSAYSS